MFLYLVKFSRPEISNAFRKASKANTGPTNAHMKSLYKSKKFLIDTKNYELVMELKQPAEKNVWEMIASSLFFMLLVHLPQNNEYALMTLF